MSGWVARSAVVHLEANWAVVEQADAFGGDLEKDLGRVRICGALNWGGTLKWFSGGSEEEDGESGEACCLHFG